MGKRRRDFDVPSVGAKRQRIAGKLHYTTKRVAHAFKVAKGYERTKLGRRQKKAEEQSNQPLLERIGTEITALKVRPID